MTDREQILFAIVDVYELLPKMDRNLESIKILISRNTKNSLKIAQRRIGYAQDMNSDIKQKMRHLLNEMKHADGIPEY